MLQTSETKARIQYSSRDELDVAVIGYCRGRSRHDLHARMRSALNGCYGPYAMAAVQAPQDEIRRQALRSVQQLTSQILEIKEQFLPELESLNALVMPTRVAIPEGEPHPCHSSSSKGSMASAPTEPVTTPTDSGPVDQPLREFLGDDAAIMAGLNPFINDLT